MEGDNILACPACGHVMLADTGARFCSSCGARLPTVEQEEDPSGRLRILTLAFVDMVGSTQMAATLNPEAFNARLHQFQRRVVRDLAAYGGSQVQHYGDGLLVCFGFASDAENAAISAVKWAVSLPKTVEPDQVRIGIHSGEVFCATDQSNQMAPKITGFELNLTARIQGQAEPGGIVISQATSQFCERLADLNAESLGDVPLKGVTDPIALARVKDIALKGLAARPLALIERDDVLDALSGEARSGHMGLMAEPGMGKSTLLDALAPRLAETHRVITWHARFNLKNTALFPVGQWLAADLGYERYPLPPQTDPGQVLASLEKLGLTGEPAGHVSDMLFGAPFGTDVMPQLARARRLQGVVALLSALSAQQKIALLIDDAQWLDSVTQELLGLILSQVPKESCQITLTSRQDAGIEAFAKGHNIELLPLAPLSAEGTQSLLETLGQPGISSEKLKLAADRAEGNPLFAVTLAQRLASMRDGDLPDTIEATYQSIITDLPKAPRSQLLDASILGRTFPREHLKLVSLNPETPRSLEPLTSKGLLAEDGSMLSFSHIFLQEAAYAMLPLSQRQERHGKVARAMEALLAEGQAVFPEIIADHAKASGDNGLTARTSMMAGISYLQNARFDLAVDYLTTSEDAFEKNGDRSIEVLTLLASAQVQQLGFTHPQVESAYLNLSKAVQGTNIESNAGVMARYGLFAHRMMSGRVRACAPLVDQMRSSATPGNSVHALLTLVNDCALALYSGDFARLDVASKELIALYDPEAHGQIYLQTSADPLVSVFTALAHRWASEGHAEKTQKIFADCEAQITRIGANLQRPWLHSFGGAALWYAGLKDDARAHITKGVALADEQGAAFWSLIGRVWQSALDLEDERAGPEMLEALLAQMQAFGIHIQRPYFDSIVASHMLRSGDAVGAKARLKANLRRVASIGAGQYASDIALRLSQAEEACANPEAAARAARIAKAYADRCQITPWIQRAQERLDAL
ncbi:MAG: adenylate/guanylate cyclase domain-containing protein [Pseudomonadota bacterium]